MKNLFINFLVFTVSVCLAFLAAEMFVRLFIKIPVEVNEPLKRSIHESSDNVKLRYKLTPNASNFEHGVWNRINSYGFRDENPLEKPKGTTRIIFLGDSVVYGDSIELADTVPQQLEKLFQSKGNKVDIMNFGVAGYETEQEVEFFKELGLQFKPDIVIVGYCLNDSNHGSGEILWFHTELKRRMKLNQKLRLDKKILTFLYRYSKLFSYIDRKFYLQETYAFLRPYHDQSLYVYLNERNKANRDSIGSPYRKLEQEIIEEGKRLGTRKDSIDYLMGNIGFKTDELHSSHWNISKQSLQELMELSKQYSFKPIFVIFPIFQEMEKYPLDSLHQFLEKETKELGYQVIDMKDWGKELYIQYGRSKLSNDSIHFNSSGAALAAHYLYDELTRRNLV